MAPDHTRKTAALADADDVHKLLAFENIDQHPVAGLHRAIASSAFSSTSTGTSRMNFTGGRVVLAQVALHGLGQARLLHELDQANLRRS